MKGRSPNNPASGGGRWALVGATVALLVTAVVVGVLIGDRTGSSGDVAITTSSTSTTSPSTTIGTTTPPSPVVTSGGPTDRVWRGSTRSAPCPGDYPSGLRARVSGVPAGDVLYLRAEPDPTSGVVASAPNGTEIFIIDGHRQTLGSSTWGLVEVPLEPGQVGEEPQPNGCAWVNLRYLGGG